MLFSYWLYCKSVVDMRLVLQILSRNWWTRYNNRLSVSEPFFRSWYIFKLAEKFLAFYVTFILLVMLTIFQHFDPALRQMNVAHTIPFWFLNRFWCYSSIYAQVVQIFPPKLCVHFCSSCVPHTPSISSSLINLIFGRDYVSWRFSLWIFTQFSVRPIKLRNLKIFFQYSFIWGLHPIGINVKWKFSTLMWDPPTFLLDGFGGSFPGSKAAAVWSWPLSSI